MIKSLQNSDVLCLAKTDFRGSNRVFGIKRKDRRQHVYVMGKTGTGKSALLHNMIVQDIANGEGLCVVDPHGELIESVIGMIPEERMNDVVYFNPADPDYHIGFNILELPDPKYKHLVASGLMGIFTKIWANVWSARMEYILNNAILALLDTPGSTLLGIPRLLVDKDFRQEIITNITDPVVKAFWINEYEQWQDKFRSEAIAPIQNKVGQFLSTSIIRNIVGQSKSTIDIFDIMNSGKIFLVDVSKGRIGEDNSDLLGAMIITKIQLSAMERVRIPNEEDRRDFYLYVDEFQNFATDAFANILSEARKYRLNLIIAHQYIGQLVTDMSTKVRDAVFGNAGTIVMFRTGAADAEFLENEFEPEFTIQDMVNLPNYHIYLKLMVDGVTCRPFSAMTLPPFHLKAEAGMKPRISDLSRKLYCRPAPVIEREINRWSGMNMDESDSNHDSHDSASHRAKPAEDGSARYSSICSSCGKNITLPFEPTEGRPVYCKSCFAKVKATGLPGELLVEERKVARSEGYSPELAAIGIEYDARNPAPLKQSIFDHPDLEETKTPESTPISLTKLKPVEKNPKQKFSKPEVNINELRDAISQSLSRAQKEEHTEPHEDIPSK
jgi:CxxC-x17-CxxC domain-containing protein